MVSREERAKVRSCLSTYPRSKTRSYHISAQKYIEDEYYMDGKISEFKKLVMRMLLECSWDDVLDKLLELRNERTSKIWDNENHNKALQGEIDEINDIERFLRDKG